MTLAAACDEAPGFSPSLQYDYDLSGTCDSSVTGYYTQGIDGTVFHYDTSRVAQPITGLLHFDTMGPVPVGSVSLETASYVWARDFTSLTPGGTYDGTTISVTYGPFGMRSNAEVVVTGVVAGDSINGTILYRSFTAGSSRRWARFVARRR